MLRWGFSAMEPKVSLSREDQKYLLDLARQAGWNALQGRPKPKPERRIGLQPYGVFVTLKKQGHLRGCIGTFRSRDVEEMVIEAALLSAFQDPRFPPVQAEEYPDLTFEISLLTPLEPVQDLQEIQVGRHGLVMEKGPFRGLLLPQVPVEQGWDRETFLKYTCLKAGLPPNCYKDPDVQIYRFEALVFSDEEVVSS